jgi:translation initiation factor IF-2
MRELLGDDLDAPATTGSATAVCVLAATAESMRMGERAAALDRLAVAVEERFVAQRAALEEELGALGQALGAVAEECEQVGTGACATVLVRHGTAQRSKERLQSNVFTAAHTRRCIHLHGRGETVL